MRKGKRKNDSLSLYLPQKKLELAYRKRARGTVGSAPLPGAMPKFGGDEEDAVRAHLMEQLKPLCEAEPEVLADYVLVLVEKDVPRAELRENCVSELSAFLQDDTEAFVTQLFSDLDSKPWKKKATTAIEGGPEQGSSGEAEHAKPAAPVKNEAPPSPSPEPGDVDDGRGDTGVVEGWDDLGHAAASPREEKETGSKRRRREDSKSSDEDEDSSRRRRRSPNHDDRNMRLKTDSRTGYTDRGRARSRDRGGIYDRGGQRSDRGGYNRRSPPLGGNQRGVSHMTGMNMPAMMAQMMANMPGGPSANMPGGAGMGGGMPPMMAAMMAAMKANMQKQGGGGFPPGRGGGGMFGGGVQPPANMPPEWQVMFRQMMMARGMAGAGTGMPGMMPGNGGGGGGGVGSGGGMDEDYNPENPGVPELQQRMQQQQQQRLLDMLNSGGHPAAAGSARPLPPGLPPGGSSHINPEQMQKMMAMMTGRGGGSGGAGGGMVGGGHGHGPSGFLGSEASAGRKGPDLRGSLVKREEWKQISDTVLVQNVPNDLCNDNSLRAYYSKFGKVVRVEIDEQSHDYDTRNARIVFFSHQQARAAVGDKEAVFNNRFIHVKFAAPSGMDEASKQAAMEQRGLGGSSSIADKATSQLGMAPLAAGRGGFKRFVRAQGDATQGGSLASHANTQGPSAATIAAAAAARAAAAAASRPPTLDALVARQKEVLAALTGKGPQGADLSAEDKTSLKKEFAALKSKVNEMLKKKQEVVLADKAQHATDASGAGAPGGRGAARGGRGGIRAPTVSDMIATTIGPSCCAPSTVLLPD